jgi:rare lipoprotein A
VSAGGSPRIASLPQSGEAAPPGEGVAEHWVRPMLLGCPVGGRGNTGNLSRVRHLVALNVGPFTKDVRVPRPWPRLRSGLREAGIVPDSNLAPPAEPDAMCAVRSCFTWSWLLLALAGCAGQPQQASAPGPSLAPNDDAAPCSQVGMESWYRGASRDRAAPQDLVAAHRSLPFGTPVQVTAIETGQAIVVRNNDRGPFVRGRIIDLSRAAAAHSSRLGRRGLARATPSSTCGRISGDRLVPLNSQDEQCLDCPPGPSNSLECRSAPFEPAIGQG